MTARLTAGAFGHGRESRKRAACALPRVLPHPVRGSRTPRVRTRVRCARHHALGEPLPIHRRHRRRACPRVQKAGVAALFEDYRPYYDNATKRSREEGLYRQNYCGCRFSDEEAAAERAERKRERVEKKAREAAEHAEERAAEGARGARGRPSAPPTTRSKRESARSSSNCGRRIEARPGGAYGQRPSTPAAPANDSPSAPATPAHGARRHPPLPQTTTRKRNPHANFRLRLQPSRRTDRAGAGSGARRVPCMLALDRSTGAIEDRIFRNIIDYLAPATC